MAKQKWLGDQCNHIGQDVVHQHRKSINDITKPKMTKTNGIEDNDGNVLESMKWFRRKVVTIWQGVALLNAITVGMKKHANPLTAKEHDDKEPTIRQHRPPTFRAAKYTRKGHIGVIYTNIHTEVLTENKRNGLLRGRRRRRSNFQKG